MAVPGLHQRRSSSSSCARLTVVLIGVAAASVVIFASQVATGPGLGPTAVLVPSDAFSTTQQQQQASRGPVQVTQTPSPTVALTVLFTTSRHRGESLHHLVDSAAVLCRRVMSLYDSSRHRYTPICVAMMTPDVPEEWIPVLQFFGYTVRRVTVPIAASEVRNPQIAREVVTDGAMGIAEMVKIEGFRMTEYDRVLMVDCDVFFHQPVEHVMRAFDSAAADPRVAALGWTKGGWESERINGGFLVFNSHAYGETHFGNILSILREGDFRSGSGWRGSGIGWTYGGRTIQGLLPYYFLHYLRENRTLQLNANSSVELSRCRFNNMVQLEPCKNTPFDLVVSNHFTGECQKPWWCTKAKHPLCEAFARHWWTAWEEMREDTAARFLNGTAHHALSGLRSRCQGQQAATVAGILMTALHLAAAEERG